MSYYYAEDGEFATSAGMHISAGCSHFVTRKADLSAIEPVIADGDQKVLKPVKALIDLQCQETAEKLATLRDHIENAVSTWQVFIGTNCEGEECALIDQRLAGCRQQLFSQIEGSAQPCPQSSETKRSI